MDRPKYLFADEAAEAEFDRLAAQERLYDWASIGSIAALQPPAGAAFLEVGPGAGSMARWMAAHGDGTGRVVVVDTRFFPAMQAPNIELRQADILEHDVGADAFDVVHLRLVLLHLADRPRALERLVRALRPGGWLVVVDLDFSLPGRAEGEAAKRLAAYMAAGVPFMETLGIDFTVGGRLPQLFRDAGLEDVHASVVAPVIEQSPWAIESTVMSFEFARRVFVPNGVMTDDQMDALIADARAGRIFITWPAVICRGRRPTS